MQQTEYGACWDTIAARQTSKRCRTNPKQLFPKLLRTGVCVTALTISLAGCAPTVKVEAPDKPIEITMNVNINHEIRVKVEQDIDELVDENPDLY